jgi:hypothetical protein
MALESANGRQAGKNTTHKNRAPKVLARGTGAGGACTGNRLRERSLLRARCCGEALQETKSCGKSDAGSSRGRIAARASRRALRAADTKGASRSCSGPMSLLNKIYYAYIAFALVAAAPEARVARGPRATSNQGRRARCAVPPHAEVVGRGRSGLKKKWVCCALLASRFSLLALRVVVGTCLVLRPKA